MQNRKFKQVNRGDELAVQNPIDGLYFEELLDCSLNDAVIAFCTEEGTHPFLNLIPKTNTNLYRVQEAFLQYIAPDGTAAGAPSSAAVADACEPANTFESGFVTWQCEGFTRLRRSTRVRDITDRDIKLCDTVPEYDIAGNRISDDFEWDAFRLGKVLLNDFQDTFLLGNSANVGETDGLLAQIDYGYIDPKSGLAAPEMDSWVFDWNGNSVCDFTTGAVGTTLNGVALSANITANLTIISMLRSYVTRVATQIGSSSISGSYNFVALANPELIRCILDCYVCETRCGCDIERMDTFEARNTLAGLHSQLGRGSVRLDFDGHGITFVPYSRGGLYDSATGLYSMIIIVPRIGNYNAWELQYKDMASAISGLPLDYKDWMVTDGGRWLHWSQIDHTCYQRHAEIQYRLCGRARWTALKVENILCVGDAFGHFSKDATSADYLGRGLQGGVVLNADSTYVPFSLR